MITPLLQTKQLGGMRSAWGTKFHANHLNSLRYGHLAAPPIHNHALATSNVLTIGVLCGSTRDNYVANSPSYHCRSTTKVVLTFFDFAFSFSPQLHVPCSEFCTL